MTETLLVTGAHGFIGSHLCEALLAAGYRVRALVTPWGSLDNLASVAGHANLEVTRADLAGASDFSGCCEGVDAIIHAAAKVGDWGGLERYWETNVNGTARLLEAAERKQVRRFVFVSTVAVHRYSGFMNADSEALPRDNRVLAYARSKMAAEDLVLGWQGEGIVVRPGLWPFGPRDPQLRRVAAALRRGALPLIDGGRSHFNTAYVGNLVHGLELAATAPIAGRRAFVIADEEPVTWREFLTELSQLLRAPPPRLSLPSWPVTKLAALVEGAWRVTAPQVEPPLTEYRAQLMRHDVHFSIAASREQLGYRPLVHWREGLKRTVREDPLLAPRSPSRTNERAG